MAEGGGDPPGEPRADLADTAAVAYSEFIRDELAEERSDKATLEQRGVAIGSTSAVAVSLLLAVLSTTGHTKPQAPANWLLGVALGLLALAAVLGTLTNVLRRVQKVTVAELRRLTEPRYWEGRREMGEQVVREQRLKSLAELRMANDEKAALLRWAIAFEGAGVVVLALGVLWAVIL
jgi:predicted metal-dependent HD superfamily phosphohydrolase